MEFAQLSQRDPNPLGERALKINPTQWKHGETEHYFLLTVMWRPRSRWRVGVALHYGAVACSNVGVDAQRDATIIGDAVNTVFRLKSLMKELNHPILLSADFQQRLSKHEDLIELGERSLKGKQQSVRVYGLPGTNSSA